jgi:hypothetical protein
VQGFAETGEKLGQPEPTVGRAPHHSAVIAGYRVQSACDVHTSSLRSLVAAVLTIKRNNLRVIAVYPMGRADVRRLGALDGASSTMRARSPRLDEYL